MWKKYFPASVFLSVAPGSDVSEEFTLTTPGGTYVMQAWLLDPGDLLVANDHGENVTVQVNIPAG